MESRSQKRPGMLGAAAALVLLVSMFLDWYKLDLPERVAGRQIDVPTFTAFEGLERSDVALVIAAVLALAFAGILAYLAGPRLQLDFDDFDEEEESGADARRERA